MACVAPPLMVHTTGDSSADEQHLSISEQCASTTDEQCAPTTDERRISTADDRSQLDVIDAAIESCVHFAPRGPMDAIKRIISKMPSADSEKIFDELALNLVDSVMKAAVRSYIEDCGPIDTIETPMLIVLQIVGASVSYCTLNESQLIDRTVAAAVAAGFGRDV